MDTILNRQVRLHSLWLVLTQYREPLAWQDQIMNSPAQHSLFVRNLELNPHSTFHI